MKRIKGLRKLLVCLLICSCVVSNQFIVKAGDQKNTCECNGIQYASLKDALDAVKENEEATITMIADETMTTSIDIENKKITLDLAGYKMNLDGMGYCIGVCENAVVTLNDSVGTGSIELCSNCGVKVVGGEFIMNAGNINNNYYAGILCDTGKLTVNGGKVSAHYPFMIGTVAASNFNYESEVVINGGTFNGIQDSYITGNSTVTIMGGYFTSEEAPAALTISYSSIESIVPNVPNVTLRGGEYHGKSSGILLYDIDAKEDYEYSFKDVLYKDSVLSDETTKKEEYFNTNSLFSANDIKILTKLTSDNVKISDIQDQTYTGNAIIPEIQVSYEENNLVNGQDYDIVCKDNINVGTATATINFKGKYTGSISKTFTIVGGTNTPEPTTNPTTVTNDTVNAKTSVKTGDSVNYIMIIGLLISGLCIVACAKKRQENMN